MSYLTNVNNDHSIDKYLIAALIISISFFFFYWLGSDIPIGIHADERYKLKQVIEGFRNYNHPLFMMHNLDLVRIISGSSDVHQLGNSARILTGIYGMLTVLITFYLARQLLDAASALVVAVLTGVTPLIGVHAQFIKEDIFSTPLLIASLYALIHWGRKPSTLKAIILGVLFGLSVSAKFSSLIFIIPLIYTFIVTSRSQSSSRIISLGIIFLSSIIVFSLIQVPAFIENGKWLAGIEKEVKHAITGHTLHLWPVQTKFIFHLQWSLLAGVGWIVMITALLGILSAILHWKRVGLSVQVIIIFALSWYAVHELSPTKIYHGGMRYMLPIAPIMALLSVFFYQKCCINLSPIIGASTSKKLFIVVSILLIGKTLHLSYPIVIRDSVDTRTFVTQNILKLLPGTVITDSYATLKYGNVGPPVGASKNKYSTADFAVVSSILYEEFLFGINFPDQPRWLYKAANNYHNLFKLPYIQINSNAPKYSYHNPVIRIIAISSAAAVWMKNADIKIQNLPKKIELHFINKTVKPDELELS